jgi:hypothetical protein
MSTSIIQQIADALLVRITGVAGMGNTGLAQRLSIDTFPACFLDRVEGEAEPGTMGGPGRKVCSTDFVWLIHARDVDAFPQMADIRKAVNDAIEVAPYDMGVAGVMRPFCKSFRLFNPATDKDRGIAELTVNVKHTEGYGAA